MPTHTILLLSLSIVLQQPTQPRRPLDSGAASVPAAHVVSQDSGLVRMERAYREILEKTNQQVGLWSNPYGLMVGALGVLFTVGAIVVGFLIYRQGREYRDLIARSITEYQNVLNGFIEEKNQQIEILKAGTAEQIAKLSQELEAATGQQKKEITRKIAELEQLSKTLKSQELPKTKVGLGGSILGGPSTGWGSLGMAPLGLGASSASTFAALGRLQQSMHKCSACGTPYSPALTSGVLGSPIATCPMCGHVDSLP